MKYPLLLCWMHHMVTELKISRCQLREISNHSSKHLSLTRETSLYSLLRKECTVSLHLWTIFVNFSFTATLWDVELGRYTLGWETWHHKEHLTTDHTMDLYDPNKCWIHSHEQIIFTQSYCFFFQLLLTMVLSFLSGEKKIENQCLSPVRITVSEPHLLLFLSFFLWSLSFYTSESQKSPRCGRSAWIHICHQY